MGPILSHLLHSKTSFMHVAEVEHGLCIVLLLRRHAIMHRGRFIVHLSAVAVVVVVTYLHSCYGVTCMNTKL